MASPVLYPQYFDAIAGPVDEAEFQKGYEELLKKSGSGSIDKIVMLSYKLLSRENSAAELERMHKGFCNIFKYREIVRKTDNYMLGYLTGLFPQVFEQENKEVKQLIGSMKEKIELLTDFEAQKKERAVPEMNQAIAEREKKIRQSPDGCEKIMKLACDPGFQKESREAMRTLSSLGRGPALPLMKTVRQQVLNLQIAHPDAKTFEILAAMILSAKDLAFDLAEQLLKIRDDECALTFSITPADAILEETFTFRMLATAFRFTVGDKIADSFDLLYDRFLTRIHKGHFHRLSQLSKSSKDLDAAVQEILKTPDFRRDVKGFVFSLSIAGLSDPTSALDVMHQKFAAFAEKVSRPANLELMVSALLAEKLSLPLFILKIKEQIEQGKKSGENPLATFFCDALDICCGVDPRKLAEGFEDQKSVREEFREKVLQKIDDRALLEVSKKLLSDPDFIRDATELFRKFLFENPLGGTYTKRESFGSSYWETIVKKYSQKVGVKDLQKFCCDDDFILIETSVVAGKTLIPEVIVKMRSLDEEIISRPQDSQDYSFMNFYTLLSEFNQFL